MYQKAYRTTLTYSRAETARHRSPRFPSILDRHDRLLARVGEYPQDDPGTPRRPTGSAGTAGSAESAGVCAEKGEEGRDEEGVKEAKDQVVCVSLVHQYMASWYCKVARLRESTSQACFGPGGHLELPARVKKMRERPMKKRG